MIVERRTTHPRRSSASTSFIAYLIRLAVTVPTIVALFVAIRIIVAAIISVVIASVGKQIETIIGLGYRFSELTEEAPE